MNEPKFKLIPDPLKHFANDPPIWKLLALIVVVGGPILFAWVSR